MHVLHTSTRLETPRQDVVKGNFLRLKMLGSSKKSFHSARGRCIIDLIFQIGGLADLQAVCVWRRSQRYGALGLWPAEGTFYSPWLTGKRGTVTTTTPCQVAKLRLTDVRAPEIRCIPRRSRYSVYCLIFFCYCIKDIVLFLTRMHTDKRAGTQLHQKILALCASTQHFFLVE